MEQKRSLENMEVNIFFGKKVFVTGHTGFKGSWLLLLLHRLGAQVKGYALAAADQSLFAILHLENSCLHIEADIRDKERLKNEILEFQPDFVFHLAAQPLVLESYRDPVYTFEVNHLGTVYLLDALRFLKKPCATIVVTTDKVYEDQKSLHPYRETDRLGGYDPYSTSKATCELALTSYRNSFFNATLGNNTQAIASARAGNVIGGGDFSKDRLIPDIFRSLESNALIKLRNPDAIRPWQHVLDALYAYVWLAARLASKPQDSTLQTAWNFGPEPGDFLRVEQVVQQCIKIYGKGSYKIEKANPLWKETQFLTLDISKAKAELKWRPMWDATISIQKTMAWYQKFVKNPDTIRDYTTAQIDEFLSTQPIGHA